MLLVMARKAFGPGISIERHITVLREVGTLLKMLFHCYFHVIPL